MSTHALPHLIIGRLTGGDIEYPRAPGTGAFNRIMALAAARPSSHQEQMSHASDLWPQGFNAHLPVSANQPDASARPRNTPPKIAPRSPLFQATPDGDDPTMRHHRDRVARPLAR